MEGGPGVAEESDQLTLVIDHQFERAAILMKEHIGASLDTVEERAATAIARMIRGRSRKD